VFGENAPQPIVARFFFFEPGGGREFFVCWAGGARGGKKKRGLFSLPRATGRAHGVSQGGRIGLGFFFWGRGIQMGVFQLPFSPTGKGFKNKV